MVVVALDGLMKKENSRLVVGQHRNISKYRLQNENFSYHYYFYCLVQTSS